MISPAIYYLYLSAVCLAISIYNIDISTTADTLICYNLQQMDESTYKKYIDSLHNNTENYLLAIEYLSDKNNSISKNNSELNSSSTYNEKMNTVPVESKNPFQTLQMGIGIIYLIICCISFILCITINHMSNMVPDEFLKMSRCKVCCGSTPKILPIINIIAHWIVFIFILTVWGFIGTNSCSKSLYNSEGVISQPEKYFNDTWILNVVNTFFWIIIHYVGCLLRDIFHEEPFMYYDRKKRFSCFKMFFFSKLGP
jgi:hypothetical protein